MSAGRVGKTLVAPLSLVLGDSTTATLLAIAAAIPGPQQGLAAASLTAFSTISQITAPRPVARGGVTQVIVEAEPPRPYMVGESYSEGVLRHRVGYGDKLDRVENPYLLEVKTFSGVGPVEALVKEQFDYADIGEYYTGVSPFIDVYYASDSQLGARPEAAALVPPMDADAPGWTADHKLSGYAAIASNYLFDKDGKRFASSYPKHGAIWKGEKAYDPRFDSTYPGGSGTHRLGDETTYTYTANPALHAGTYAYGRFQNGIKVFGIGLDGEGIDWAAVVDWANTCDANGWTVNGTIWEGGAGRDVRQQRVQNIDDLCAAGGGRWITAGALLSFDWHRPRTSLATITDDDILIDGSSITTVQSVRDRMNGVRPQYISADHNWEQITADEIVGTTYRTEDGQPLTQMWPLNLVTDADQAGQLAAYAMADSREIGPIELTLKAPWRFYKPGECVTIDSEIFNYTGKCVILSRELDAATFTVRMVLKSETDAKHAFALGQTATPPPTPVVGQTGEERDAVIGGTIVSKDVVFADIPGFRVAADSDGITTTALPLTTQISLTRDGVDIIGEATLSVPTASAGIEASIDSGGVLSLDVADANGSITVRAVVDGITYDKQASVSRSLAGGTSGGLPGSSSFNDYSWTSVSGTTFVPVTDAGAIVQSNASGELSFTASSNYLSPESIEIKAQYSPDGTTWTDAGAVGEGLDAGEPSFVSLVGGRLVTGLTPSTDYFVRLVARQTTSGTSIGWLDSVFTARRP